MNIPEPLARHAAETGHLLVPIPLTPMNELRDEETDGPTEFFIDGDGKLRTPARYGSREVAGEHAPHQPGDTIRLEWEDEPEWQELSGPCIDYFKVEKVWAVQASEMPPGHAWGAMCDAYGDDMPEWFWLFSDGRCPYCDADGCTACLQTGKARHLP